MKPIHLTCLCGDQTLAVFQEVVELLYHGLRRAGAKVDWAPRSLERGALNVCVAGHRLPAKLLPTLAGERVIVNLEQVCDPQGWRHTDPAMYRALLASGPVLDYSERNRAWLERELGVHAELLRLGHVPELERIARAAEQDIDVLFYGEITPWREQVLTRLKESGLRVATLVGAPSVYGATRDALIARSRVVLNLHQYDTRIFEQVRVNYLLVNGKAVVSEVRDDTEIPPMYRDLIEPAATLEALVDRCRDLALVPARRRVREEAARESMRAWPQEKLLASLDCLAAGLP